MKHASRFVRGLVTALLLAIALAAVGAASAESYATVSGTNTLNLRSAGSSSSGWLGSYSRGTWVTIIGSSNNFYQVRTPDGKTGYMSKNYLLCTDNFGWDNVAIVSNASAGAFLNLRAEASYNARVITILYNGVPLTILGESDGWYRVEMGATYGYVRTEYTFTSYQPIGNNVATIKTPNNSAINLRAAPSSNAAVIRQFSGDRYVSVICEGNGWWYVTIDGHTGFMSSDFLREGLHAARDESSGGTGYATVTSSQYLNLRAQPSASAQVVAKLTNGMRLTMVKQGTEWCEVYSQSSGLLGYVMTRYLKLTNLPSTPTRQVVHPQGSYVNLRASASMTSSVAARMSSYQTVTVVAPGDNWTKVKYNGKVGYVMTYFLKD